jgi:uncharacterized protein (TIGR02145 family)
MKNIYKISVIMICLLFLSTLSIKVNAQHFNFVGGDPSYPLWTIYIHGATFDGINLEDGDEIAVFDYDLLVGVFTLDQVCTPDNGFENDLIAFSVLNTQAGYQAGNEFTFKCWDASVQEESNFSIYEFFDPYGDAYMGNVFPADEGEYSIVTLDFFNYMSTSQTFNLSYGYQFISSRVDPVVPDMLFVMTSVLNDNLDFVRNSQGQTLRKIGPNWVNGIGDWIVDEGYLVKMNADDSFTINGDMIDPATPIPVETGFQFVSYFPEDPIDALEAFATIIGDNLDFVRNSQGQTLRKIGPNWVNGIGDCQSGEGYLVKMFADDILIYPGSSSFTCGELFTDPRDGQTYNTVQIGDQCWMAENLNIGEMIIAGPPYQTNNGIIEKYCYDDDPANCKTYGGLYQWNEIMEYITTQGVQGICPGGWHLPTDGEWTIVTDFLGGENVAGGKMKETDTAHWLPPNYGATNESGFTALPGGDYHGLFKKMGSRGNWWSSTENSSTGAWKRSMYYYFHHVYRARNIKNVASSVRCVRDIENLPPELPSYLNPEDGAENQSIETFLWWTCTDPENDPMTYDIYFGTEAIPPQVATGQTEINYDPGTLEINTEYFWKIVAHDDHENTTVGSVWSFTTGDDPFLCGDSFTDLRDGKVYSTVLIGNQCLMAENLNIGEMINGNSNMSNNGVIEKYCYNNDPANCDTYGGLYQWNEMMEYTTTQGVRGICPSSWHLPTDGEWTTVTDFLGGESVAGGKMKETGTTHWNSPNTAATNESGFSALPGGIFNEGSFYVLLFYGGWWSSTEDSFLNAWRRSMYYDYGIVYRSPGDKTSGFSVRCVRDETAPPPNQPPEPPSSPIPEDGAINQFIETNISWTCTDPEGGPLTYDIYFGIQTTPPQVATAQTETTYDLEILENNTEYFWKIVAHDDHGNITEGSVWSFTTGGDSFLCGDPFTDLRDGQIYNTVLIGVQCWMAENLNIGEMIFGYEEMTDNGVIEKYCFGNNVENCDEYGGLYQWNETMEYTNLPGEQSICPDGWYLPIDNDWKILEGIVDSYYPVGDPIWDQTGWRGHDAGFNLKSQNGWSIYGNGSDAYGFTAIPAGKCNINGTFNYLGSRGFWWSSTEYSSYYALKRCMDFGYDNVYRNNYSKTNGLSVRCIRDNSIIHTDGRNPFANLSNGCKNFDNKLSGQKTKKIDPVHFVFKGGNPAEAVYTIYVEGLNIGDEVAAFDGHKIVGATRINSENTFENELPVFSTLISGEGYEEGNPIILKVWSENNIVPADFTMEVIYDSYVSDVYPDEDGKYSVVNIIKASLPEAEEIISVYPNPATENISIISTNEIFEVSILNSFGQSVYESQINDTNIQINTSNLESGIYIIRIKTMNGLITHKLIIN